MAQIPDMQLEIGEIKPAKWEYKVVSIPKLLFPILEEDTKVLMRHLNPEGRNGWELVSIDNGIAYFKRPIWNPE